MRRLPKTHKKLPMRKQDEPDFYMLDKSNPLPSIEDAPIPGGLSVSNAMRGGNAGAPGGAPGGPGGPGMGGPMGPQGGAMPPSMQAGRMMAPPSVSHVPQPRFGQGVYNDPLVGGQDDFGDMGGAPGASGMMGRGLMQSSANGAFRSPMHPGQNMQGMGRQGMAGPSGRMPQAMGGRGSAAGMGNQMYPGATGMSNQLMNQMQAGGAPNRMNAAGMRRFRPMPGMDAAGMSGAGEQGMMPSGFSQDGMAGNAQDDFYSQHRSQASGMRARMPMDPMTPMPPQMFNDRAGMQDPGMPAPYGDMQGAAKNDMYGGNFRDMPANTDFMYRGGGGASEGGGVPPMGGAGSEDYMGMVSPMARRSRPPM